MYIFGNIFSVIYMYIYIVLMCSYFVCFFIEGKLLMLLKIKCFLIGFYFIVWVMWRGFNISLRVVFFKLVFCRLVFWRL